VTGLVRGPTRAAVEIPTHVGQDQVGTVHLGALRYEPRRVDDRRKRGDHDLTLARGGDHPTMCDDILAP
jgi:hypothetical protein